MHNCYPLKTTQPFERGGSLNSNTIDLPHYETYTPSQKSTTHTSDFLKDKATRIAKMKICGSKNGGTTAAGNCEREEETLQTDVDLTKPMEFSEISPKPHNYFLEPKADANVHKRGSGTFSEKQKFSWKQEDGNGKMEEKREKTTNIWKAAVYKREQKIHNLEVARPNSRRSTRRSTSLPKKRGCIQKVPCKRKKEAASGRGRPKRARPNLRQRSPLTSSREDSNPPPAVDANGLEGLNAYQSLVKRNDQIVCPKFKRIPALLDCDEWDSSDSNEDLNDEVFLRMNLKEEMRQKLYYSRLQDVRKKEEAHRIDPSIVVPPRPTGTNAVVLSKSQAELEPVIPKGFGRLPTFNYTVPENPANWRNPPRLIRVVSYGTGPISSKPHMSCGGKSCTWAKKGREKLRSGKGNSNASTGNLPAVVPSLPTTVTVPPTGSKHSLEIIAKEKKSDERSSMGLTAMKCPLREPLSKRSKERQLDDSLSRQPLSKQRRLDESNPKRPKRLLLRLRRRAS